MNNELKAYRFVLATENTNLGGVVYNSNYVYAQDDVDKVIAEKDAQILDLTERVQKERAAKVDYKISANDLNDGLKKAYEEIDHQKHKRCLAMAKWCNEKWLVHNFAEIPTKLGFYDKWEKRWKELAEEPTWARFLQLIHKEAK